MSTVPLKVYVHSLAIDLQMAVALVVSLSALSYWRDMLPGNDKLVVIALISIIRLVWF